ncbi:hypothetical protein Pfo_016331, partial [Paulownia fortunei]
TKYRGSRFSHRRVIAQIFSYMHMLRRSGLCELSVWKGDVDIATKSGFHIVKPLTPFVKQVVWRGPDSNFCKLNYDGASRGNPGSAVAGGVIRNHIGRTRFAYYNFLVMRPNTYAKLFAIAKGIRLSFEHNI